MIGHLTARRAPAREQDNAALFVRRWVANPLRMGSIAPSSPALCRKIVRHGWPEPGKIVIELGGGTGVIARAFLRAGLPPERLVVVEIDPDLSRHLRDTMPGVRVLTGDARDLPNLLPDPLRRRAGTVICGIPLVLLPLHEQRRFIDAIRLIDGPRA